MRTLPLTLLERKIPALNGASGPSATPENIRHAEPSSGPIRSVAFEKLAVAVTSTATSDRPSHDAAAHSATSSRLQRPASAELRAGKIERAPSANKRPSLP